MNFDFNPKMDKMLGDIKEIGKLKQKEKAKEQSPTKSNIFLKRKSSYSY